MDTARVDEIIARHRAEQGSLISILHEIQRAEGYIGGETMSQVSSRLRIPLSEVFRVVSYFGKSFSMERRAKHAVKVCQGTACYLKQGTGVLEELKEVMAKEEAGRDCWLEAVRCLGCCGEAPAVEVDGRLVDKEGAKKAIIALKGET